MEGLLVGPEEPESPISALRSWEQAPEPKGLNPAWKYGPAVASLFDSWTTQKALDSGLGLREGNPLMAPFAKNDLTLYAVPAAIGLIQGYLGDKLAKMGHPRVAKAFSGLGVGLHLGAGAMNLSTIERERREWGQ